MNLITRRLLMTAAATLMPITALSGMPPAIGAADPIVPNCPGGWWDPAANICRPPVSTTPLNCENGWWWDPVGNVCRPPVIPPQ